MGYFTEIKQLLTINRRNFGGRRNITDRNTASQILLDMIETGNRLSVIRMGFVELDLLYEYEEHKDNDLHSYSNNNAYRMKAILDNDPSFIKQYANLIFDAYNNADMIANWYYSRKEGNLIRRYAPTAALTSGGILSPFYSDIKWTKALRGKKVLIIHPFSKTITSQYSKRSNLFSDPDILPEFDLITLESVWFSSTDKDSRFKNWFEALDYMKSEIYTIDFDVALLGCGPFGVPLTDYIKSIGKQAIYVGGVLQIYFGIKGGRWDKDSTYSSHYNEYWVRPDEEFRPKNYKKVDNSCYW